MHYKHFFAALVAAFFLSVNVISAQESKEELTKQEFELLVADDAPRVYQLALEKRLSFDQLRFFISYLTVKNRNTVYLEGLYKIYWQQSTHKDKLDYEHFMYIEENYFKLQPKKPKYELIPSFAYVLAHQSDYQEAWGDLFYSPYLLSHLNFTCYEINLVFDEENIPSIAEREKIAEHYINTIKPHLPKEEARLRAKVYCDCVYNVNTEAAQYYAAVDKYAINYCANAKELDRHTTELLHTTKQAKYLQMGLNWINKAIGIEQAAVFFIHKAELLYRLRRINEAKQTLALAKAKINEYDQSLLSDYQKIEQLIYADK